ncbi:MAG: P-loop NTPase fold protein [Pseudomonadota bacterium]
MTQKFNDEIWAGDLLGREEEAMYLQRYFENFYSLYAKEESSFVLNVNSEWGHGKTWFLERLAKQLQKNYPVVYFNAWKNDFTKDALLSFVSVVCTELTKQFQGNAQIIGRVERAVSAFSSFSKKAVPIIAAISAKQLTGYTLESLVGVLDGDLKSDASDTASSLAKLAATCSVKEFSQKKSGIESFEQAIKELVNEIAESEFHLPIFIFIDELDRCRPTYAIELLESIKHLFSVAGVYFVVATDTKQLSHSIKSVYGQEFNSIAYLKRFFYVEYRLAEPNYEKMANFFFQDTALLEKLFIPQPLLSDYGASKLFGKTAEYFKLTARDQEQVFAVLKTVLIISSEKNIHYIYLLFLICLKHRFSNENEFETAILVPSRMVAFINDLRKSNRLKEVKISTMYWNQSSGHGGKRDIGLGTVFDFYFELANENVENLASRSAGVRDGDEYKQKIIFELLKNQNGKKQDSTVRSNELSSYIKMLLQAGRITVST